MQQEEQAIPGQQQLIAALSDLITQPERLLQLGIPTHLQGKAVYTAVMAAMTGMLTANAKDVDLFRANLHATAERMLAYGEYVLQHKGCPPSATTATLRLEQHLRPQQGKPN